MFGFGNRNKKTGLGLEQELEESTKQQPKPKSEDLADSLLLGGGETDFEEEDRSAPQQYDAFGLEDAVEKTLQKRTDQQRLADLQKEYQTLSAKLERATDTGGEGYLDDKNQFVFWQYQKDQQRLAKIQDEARQLQSRNQQDPRAGEQRSGAVRERASSVARALFKAAIPRVPAQHRQALAKEFEANFLSVDWDGYATRDPVYATEAGLQQALTAILNSSYGQIAMNGARPQPANTKQRSGNEAPVEDGEEDPELAGMSDGAKLFAKLAGDPKLKDWQPGRNN